MAEIKPALPFAPPPASGNIFSGFNWQVGLITGVACLASLLEVSVYFCGGTLISGSVVALSPVNNRTVTTSSSPAEREWELRQRQWEEQVRQQQEESRRRLEEMNRRTQTRPVNPPTPPPYSPPPNMPSPRAPVSGNSETRPGGKLSPTNRNNASYIPPAGGTKPGAEVTNPAQVRAGDKVHIFWGGSWFPGVVLGTEQGLIKVHYDNHADSWDELASLQRVRLMNSPGVSTFPPAPAPPAPFTPAPASPTPVTPVPTPPPATPPEMRTWTDSTGRFKLDAKLVGLENGNVKLERPDGKIVTMPLDKLTPADQAVVRAQYP